ncbi:uncharacterized protein MONOS_12776 [Monocercomonoides exilis]|uniref:uncharacterized protein n=1 Tax=Monocercomonoides exilis TaxID=2049356 RepID=UPI00355ACA81|nr:hypothetical protein MONOS_12776 [Monocercomonoides exilis]|eukprot:MONOS_12776.1-p1 / transcript=MONOS_12776.1 / gene=MONOS_12776 / organism=Monocercomonoides_exilis_PA203 / gene_product=unspecified product / transcript_product=unspecified product / location=Mono_scaffold00732:3494-3990(-) / protein_length=99 / sequence_SO=supercontig / SO=protein_coding / is_pseudo=false
MSISEIESRIDSLSSRVDQIESMQGDDTEALRQYKLNILKELRILRSTMYQDRRKHLEMEEKLAKVTEENLKLKDSNAHLNYRILHLVKNLKECRSSQ